MNKVIHQEFLSQAQDITRIIENFDTTGKLFVDGKRNKIRLFELGNLTVNVKSFKIPNVINKIVYRFSGSLRHVAHMSLLLFCLKKG
jgi:hypothetical protein